MNFSKDNTITWVSNKNVRVRTSASVGDLKPGLAVTTDLDAVAECMVDSETLFGES